MIPYGTQQITDADIEAVVAALRSPMLTQGPIIEEFEQEFARAVGAKYAVAVNSGTAALHAAYFAAGIGPGNSVLTSPITFVATANASLYLGGNAEFADVGADIPALTAESIGNAPRPAVKALVPVHFGGHVCDMGALSSLAQSRGWAMIEDAAHALGARYRVNGGAEFKVGACAHSDMCCFSFHPVKHITTGEGGAVTTNSESLYRKLRQFRTHGITRDESLLRQHDGPWYYEQHALGFNYRITDFQAALGLSQLKRLTGFVARRREIAARYDVELSGVVDAIAAPDWSVSSYHLYVIRVAAERRLEIFNKLRSAGLGVNVHYIPVYNQPFYRDLGFAAGRFPNADRYYSEAITVPMYPDLTDDQAAYVIAQIRGAVSGTGDS
ncbi:MAG TPA: UDP-4-amino-4,6-dideoxy-N-acetyl-beta-L-altrosamine transaminase [Gemmatimonadaceae bacterium]|nr:UDP-4-amino-4,6-dideoxy-N-acetyl-beta-L-altrosamine transaminase [Gemmatimonadaceae bacterium]